MTPPVALHWITVAGCVALALGAAQTGDASEAFAWLSAFLALLRRPPPVERRAAPPAETDADLTDADLTARLDSLEANLLTQVDRLCAERDSLRAEVERLRAERECQ